MNKILLDFLYIYIISSRFIGEGFSLNFDVNRYLLSWIYFSIGLAFISQKMSDVRSLFNSTFFLNSLVPILTLFGCDQSRGHMPMLATLFALIFIATMPPLRLFEKERQFKSGRLLTLLLLIILCGTVALRFFMSKATVNFDLLDVYAFREANAALVAGGVFSYLNNWTYQIATIFLLAIALEYRRYLLVILLLLLQLYFFGISSHKTILFYPFVYIALRWFLKNYNDFRYYILAYNGVFALVIFLYKLTENSLLSSFVVRRVFLLPAKLNFDYFAYFSNNDFILWSNSFLSFLFDYPYDTSVGHLIGDYLQSDMGANNGLVSMGFAHAGFVGILVYLIFLWVILSLIHTFRGYTPFYFSGAFLFIPLRNIQIQSDLLTVLLTHGLLFAIVIVISWQRRRLTD